ncbi:ABC transporter ATP-binding protein [Natronorarus salvus]|uniref:ABC transporter ATP-binding protein n=1 Tax=Natronorarus salvus TaxID=3117733 RepID=UPI002F26469E
MKQSKIILQTEGLEKYYISHTSLLDKLYRQIIGDLEYVKAVDGVSLDLTSNQVEGVIGESGCGKTTLIKTLIGLEENTGGEIIYNGKNRRNFNKSDWKNYRNNIQMIFQDPYNSLNPKMRVEDIVSEPLDIHGISNKEEKVLNALHDVELEPVSQFVRRKPPQLSGGQKQRVAIARALVSDPDIILADEPVSMLDVSTQASILKLLSKISSERDFSMIYISHDLSTVSYVCDNINVMYLGRIVESGPTKEILTNPKHPYTKALIKAIPTPDPNHKRPRTELKGDPGSPTGEFIGCRFKERCPERMEICSKKPKSVIIDGNPNHKAACHLYYSHSNNEEVRRHEDTSRLFREDR